MEMFEHELTVIMNDKVFVHLPVDSQTKVILILEFDDDLIDDFMQVDKFLLSVGLSVGKSEAEMGPVIHKCVF